MLSLRVKLGGIGSAGERPARRIGAGRDFLLKNGRTSLRDNRMTIDDEN
jgi:hypothetical protein